MRWYVDGMRGRRANRARNALERDEMSLEVARYDVGRRVTPWGRLEDVRACVDDYSCEEQTMLGSITHISLDIPSDSNDQS